MILSEIDRLLGKRSYLDFDMADFQTAYTLVPRSVPTWVDFFNITRPVLMLKRPIEVGKRKPGEDFTLHQAQGLTRAIMFPWGQSSYTDCTRNSVPTCPAERLGVNSSPHIHFSKDLHLLCFLNLAACVRRTVFCVGTELYTVCSGPLRLSLPRSRQDTQHRPRGRHAACGQRRDRQLNILGTEREVPTAAPGSLRSP